jgi:hypothetical protein
MWLLKNCPTLLYTRPHPCQPRCCCSRRRPIAVSAVANVLAVLAIVIVGITFLSLHPCCFTDVASRLSLSLLRDPSRGRCWRVVVNVAVVASCISIRPAAATSLWFSWMRAHIGWQWWWWLEWSGLQDKSANRIQDKRRSEWRGPRVMICPSQHPRSGCESKITCDAFPTFGLYACIQSFASIFICSEIREKGGFLQATPKKKTDEKTEKKGKKLHTKGSISTSNVSGDSVKADPFAWSKKDMAGKNVRWVRHDSDANPKKE